MNIDDVFNQLTGKPNDAKQSAKGKSHEDKPMDKPMDKIGEFLSSGKGNTDTLPIGFVRVKSDRGYPATCGSQAIWPRPKGVAQREIVEMFEAAYNAGRFLAERSVEAMDESLPLLQAFARAKSSPRNTAKDKLLPNFMYVTTNSQTLVTMPIPDVYHQADARQVLRNQMPRVLEGNPQLGDPMCVGFAVVPEFDASGEFMGYREVEVFSIAKWHDDPNTDIDWVIWSPVTRERNAARNIKRSAIENGTTEEQESKRHYDDIRKNSDEQKEKDRLETERLIAATLRAEELAEVRTSSGGEWDIG